MFAAWTADCDELRCDTAVPSRQVEPALLHPGTACADGDWRTPPRPPVSHRGPSRDRRGKNCKTHGGSWVLGHPRTEVTSQEPEDSWGIVGLFTVDRPGRVVFGAGGAVHGTGALVGVLVPDQDDVDAVPGRRGHETRPSLAAEACAIEEVEMQSREGDGDGEYGRVTSQLITV